MSKNSNEEINAQIMKPANLNRSIFLTCFFVGSTYIFVYVTSCYKINIKSPNHDFVGDFLLVVAMLLASSLIVNLVNFARYHQRQIVEFDSDAVDSFGRRYGLIALVGFGFSEGLNYIFSSVGLKTKFILELPGWLMIICVSYVLYTGNLTLYRCLTNAAKQIEKK